MVDFLPNQLNIFKRLLMNTTIPLFPLGLVLFPGGALPLKIFEKRYVDMVRDCLRNETGFGIVASIASPENAMLPFADIGVSVKITQADVSEPGLFHIRCLAQDKFKVIAAKQQADGLWLGEIEILEKENDMPIPDDLFSSRLYFEQLIDSLQQQIEDEYFMPFDKPYQLNSCLWLANRWCEILNLPLQQKQNMLALDSPLIRLELVHDMLTKRN